MKRRLSPRAELVLAYIRESTHRDDAGNLTRYMVPPRNPYLGDLYGESQCRDGRDGFRLNGSGDARIIKSFADAGLVKMMPIATYACAITESGIVLYERIAARRRLGV